LVFKIRYHKIFADAIKGRSDYRIPSW